MDLLAILAKIAKKEELTAGELAFVKDYKLPEVDETRIPKKRFDDINTKYKDSQKEVKRLEGELETSTERVEELESGDLSEADKAKKAWDKEKKKLEKEKNDAIAERDAAQGDLNSSVRKGKISDLAAKHKFEDSEYLSHLIKSSEVDLEDESAVGSFMKGLETDRPNLFKSNIKPGSSTKPGETVVVSDAQTRINEILALEKPTSREQAEVVTLQAEVKKEAEAAN